jgi:hypothetical protein
MAPVIPRIRIASAGGPARNGVALGEDAPVADDDGTEIVTALVGMEAQRLRWCAFWVPAASGAEEGKVRFEVAGTDGRTRCSSPFDAGDPPRPPRLGPSDCGVEVLPDGN